MSLTMKQLERFLKLSAKLVKAFTCSFQCPLLGIMAQPVTYLNCGFRGRSGNSSRNADIEMIKNKSSKIAFILKKIQYRGHSSRLCIVELIFVRSNC